MTDITINYQSNHWNSGNKGSITIHLEEFLAERSISKVRKLLKLINQYGDGSEVQKIMNIIEQFKQSYKIDQKLNEKKVIGYTDKIQFTDQQIKNLVSNRSQFKKCSDGFEHYNKQVKMQREELRRLKACLYSTNSNFKRNESLNKFYDRCLAVMQG